MRPQVFRIGTWVVCYFASLGFFLWQLSRCPYKSFHVNDDTHLHQILYDESLWLNLFWKVVLLSPWLFIKSSTVRHLSLLPVIYYTSHQGVNTFPVRLWLTWNLEPWTLFVLDPLDRFSALTTLSLVSPAQETTGPRVITPKVIVLFAHNPLEFMFQARLFVLVTIGNRGGVSW